MRSGVGLFDQSSFAKFLLQGPDAEAVLLVNKLDLIERWEVAPGTLVELRQTLPVIETSALSGDGVEQAFLELANRLGG